MAIDQDLPLDLATRVEDELEGGERLLWAGQPRPGRFFLQSLPVFVFGIPWTAFAVFWTVVASGLFFGHDGGEAAPREGLPGPMQFFWLFGVPFVLIGFCMLSAPFWALRKAKKTVYAVTDRRAIIFEGGRGMKVASYRGDRLEILEHTERADGSGDIIFEREYYRGRKGRRRVRTIGFLGCPNVREVEQMLGKIARRDRETGGADASDS